MNTPGEVFPRVALGCMFYGTRIEPAVAFRLLDMFKDAGETLLDTADNYAFWASGTRGGESEMLLGQWLAQPGRRDGMKVATKVGARPLRAGGSTAEAEGLSAPSVRSAVEASLRRLQLETIDLCYAHIDNRQIPLEETLGAFSELVTEGKIRAIGASNMRTDRFRDARVIASDQGMQSYEVLQQRHSLLCPLPESDFGVQAPSTPELLNFLAAEQIPLVAYSPFLDGALVAPNRPLPATYDSDDNKQRQQQIANRAVDLHVSMTQLTLAVLIAQHVIPLLGASSPEQLIDSLGARELQVTSQLVQELSPHRDLVPVSWPVT